jgi:Stage II sporulation protein E (SpoIIE)
MGNQEPAALRRRATSAPYTVWARVRSRDGGERCGDVVVTARLPNGRLALVVVDFIGGGTHRALRAAAFANHLMTLISLGVRPANALRFADAELQRGGWEDDLPPLATAFAGFIDPVKRTLTYSSAAHETALLLTSGGMHRHLESTGPVAGIFDTFGVSQADVAFEPGESLVIVTDGIPDSHSGDGPFYGSAGTVRTATLALRYGENPADALVSDAVRHGARPDDAAALVVRCELRSRRKQQRTAQLRADFISNSPLGSLGGSSRNEILHPGSLVGRARLHAVGSDGADVAARPGNGPDGHDGSDDLLIERARR